MNGIICMMKPEGFTSFDVVAKMRGILRTKKIGHAGTLDPMATGVLPIFIGYATKACDMMPDNDKAYVASFKLGLITDTQDRTGKTLKTFDKKISLEEMSSAVEKFQGDLMQIPPMYSAVQVNGQRLYDLARKGIEVKREARPITLYENRLLEFDEFSMEGKLYISCSKGTYIRTIINDIGESLGSGGIMTSLERVKACGFKTEDCVTFDTLQSLKEGGDFSSIILPISKVFEFLPMIKLNEVQTRMYKNGIRLDADRIIFKEDSDRYRVFGFDDEFIGTAKRIENEIIIEKNFYNRNSALE